MCVSRSGVWCIFGHYQCIYVHYLSLLGYYNAQTCINKYYSSFFRQSTDYWHIKTTVCNTDCIIYTPTNCWLDCSLIKVVHLWCWPKTYTMSCSSLEVVGPCRNRSVLCSLFSPLTRYCLFNTHTFAHLAHSTSRERLALTKSLSLSLSASEDAQICNVRSG